MLVSDFHMVSSDGRFLVSSSTHALVIPRLYWDAGLGSGIWVEVMPSYRRDCVASHNVIPEVWKCSGAVRTRLFGASSDRLFFAFSARVLSKVSSAKVLSLIQPVRERRVAIIACRASLFFVQIHPCDSWQARLVNKDVHR